MIKVASALSSALLVLGAHSVSAAEQPDAPAPDPRACVERRAAIEAALKGELNALEMRAKGLRDRRASFAGQISAERADIAKLEALVRGWLEKAP